MQPDISPLARRLAEENNVKWQGLYGSGSEGRIVERDVLEYLARVMAGEEDLNPTAEPLPAGMDAWPEEDLTAANITATKTAAPTPQVTLTPVKSYDLMAGDMLADDMLADDLGVDDFASVSASATEADDALDLDLTFEAAPAASTPSGNVTPQDGAEAVDDDMFLFDDAFDDEAMLTADTTFTADEVQEDVPEDVSTFTAATQLEAVDFDLDSDESDAFDVLADDLQALELETDDVETEDVSFEAVLAAAPTPADVQDIALFAESADTDLPTEADTDVSLFVSDETASDDTDVEADAVAGFEEVEATEAEVTEVGATEVATLEADSDDDEDTGLGAADAFDTSMDADTVDAETMAAEAETDTARTTDSAEETEVVAPAYSGVDVAAPLVAPYKAPQAAPSTFAAAATSPQLVSYGLLLRRRVDLTKLMAAQVSIGQELGQDGPVAPSSLLLRAAAKTLLTLPLNEHQNVGLAVFGDRGVQLASLNDVTTRPFRDVVAAVAQPQASNSTDFGPTAFGVVVADMSDFDIDEAVLNAGAPVLTLGRVLYDNTEGSHHSTLALSGEMTVEQGTKFLAVVADLLDAPIRLVI